MVEVFGCFVQRSLMQLHKSCASCVYAFDSYILELHMLLTVMGAKSQERLDPKLSPKANMDAAVSAVGLEKMRVHDKDTMLRTPGYGLLSWRSTFQ